MAAGDSSLVGTSAALVEGSGFDRWAWPGADQMGANCPSADPPGADASGVDPPGAGPPGADPPGADLPGVDPPGLDQPGADPSGADLWVRPLGCSTSGSPRGVPAATGYDCGC